MSNTSEIGGAEFEILAHKKTALLFGATGLIGGHLFKAICTHQAYNKVTSFGRREIKATHPKLEHFIIDFSDLEKYAHLIKGNDIYIALGTTIKKAGSQAAFRAVDYDLIFNVAKIASLNDVSQLILVSSIGASPDSMFFYTKVKGELEVAIQKLPFWAAHIFRPSVLLGDREEDRTLEKIGVGVSRRLQSVIGGLFGKYNPIDAETVARAMVQAAQQMNAGTYFYQSPLIEELGEKYLKV